MDKNKTLTDFEELIRECVKCGVCQAHCPTYQVNKEEGSVARGKIALAAALIDNETGLEDRLQEDMSMCLMCGSCVNKCPNKVPTNEIVGAIRREITDNQGLSLIGKGVSTLLSQKILMKTLGKGGALLSPLILKKIPESSGLRLRFPSPVMKERTIPKVPFKNLFERVPEYTAAPDEKGVVGFFAGCALSYIYPEIGSTMVKILNRMGYSVYLPKAQGCCGIPALSSGNGELVTNLAEKNVKAFQEKALTHIVTACGSCNGGIGEHYETMKEDFSEFTGKVIDFSVFLKQSGLFEELILMEKWQNRKLVTYHDPCHTSKGLGISEQPRHFLKQLGKGFVDNNSLTCCGFGGMFSIGFRKTSRAIMKRKMEELKEHTVSTLVTSCPGCLLYFKENLPEECLFFTEIFKQVKR